MKRSVAQTVKVVQPQKPADEVPTEVLATAVLSISEGIKRLRAGRLNDRALVLLIQNAAPTHNYRKPSQGEVEAVLAGMEQLEAAFIRKRP